VVDVIIDTSSILFALANGHDVFDAVKRRFPHGRQVVSQGVIRELKGLSMNAGKHGIWAKTALVAISVKDIKVADSNMSVDKWIFDAAAGSDCVVVTNDTELVDKLDGVGVRAFKVARNGALR
jgi:rRNA-processing protein FCF1